MRSNLVYFLLLVSTVFQPTVSAQPLQFAFVSDTHVGAPVTAAEDLQRTVDDINTLSDIDFVVFTGDVTDFGSDEELALTKRILDGLKKKWYVIPGNHDTKWSENGCNSFQRVLGMERFAFTFGKYRFIGCGSGPNMRMAPGLVTREDVLWLREEIEKRMGSDQPVIFLNHYPLDDGLANWYLLIDELKKSNIQAALCGHGHRNRLVKAEGIPSVMGRSNLRAGSPVGGYNLVTIRNDTMFFAERNPATVEQPAETKPIWTNIVLQNHQFNRDTTAHYPRPSYEINDRYPQVKVVWQQQDDSDIGAGITADKSVCIYSNAKGQLVALSPENGRVRWRFATHGKVYSTPALHKNRVVVASTDGMIYCLNKKDGNLCWKVETGRPIVASPLIDGKTIFIGSSEGKFRALALSDGALRWEFSGVKGFVESTPVADSRKVYFGTWGSSLYALDKRTGEVAWTWTNGKIRNYSPAACVPVLAGRRIFIQTPDRTVTAIDTETGKEIWKSNLHKGFESIGISNDKSVLYVKCLNDSIWALSTTADHGRGEWFVNCHYGHEISPSPITERDGLLYIPTDEGVLYAVDRRTRQVAWGHKLSNAMVNRVFPLPGHQVLVTTMDGKIMRLKAIDPITEEAVTKKMAD